MPTTLNQRKNKIYCCQLVKKVVIYRRKKLDKLLWVIGHSQKPKFIINKDVKNEIYRTR